MRKVGDFLIATNYEVRTLGPFDARMLTGLKSDLTDVDTWRPDASSIPATYAGMIVSVTADTEENNGLYILKKLPFTVEENWVKLFDEKEFDAFQEQLGQDLSNYVTQEQLSSYSKLSINNKPEQGDGNTIYFVENDGNWEEYIWYNGQYVQIGSNSGDFSNYYTKQEIDEKIAQVEAKIPDVSNFITITVDNLVNYYNKTEVDNKLSQIATIGFAGPFDELPETGESNKIYLIRKDGTSQDEFDEYIWIDNNWEKIGNAVIDTTNFVTNDQLTQALASYVTTESLTQALAGKQDTLVSGTNIKTINGQSILGEGNIEIQGGGITSIPVATNTALGGILATDSSASQDVSAYVDVEADGKAFVKIPSVDETSTVDDVVSLLNTDTLILNGNGQ